MPIAASNSAMSLMVTVLHPVKACAEKELEGIVSKHALAPYRSGRSKTWLKTKCFTQSTFVVIGTDRDRKTGALRVLLAHNDGAA